MTALTRFRPGGHLLCLTAALLLLSVTWARPMLPLQRDTYRYVFVVDITQSMNARDYHLGDLPGDRLGFVKHALREALKALPCDSEIGLGVFTAKNMYLLLEPLEVCWHFSVIEQTILHIDWRMAWAADSHIGRGLFASIREVAAMKHRPDLVFFTDGQQTPAEAMEPPFLGRPGQVKGLIVGVGGTTPVPVPKLDTDNVSTGFWTAGEAEGSRRFKPHDGDGGPGPDAAEAPYRSALQETALKRLAGVTGLSYHRLESPDALIGALESPRLTRRRTVPTDVRSLFASAALLLIIGIFLPDRASTRGGPA